MKPFLKQVADHYFSIGDISSKCFVFPNRRSMVFFTKYLCEAVSGGIPIVVPQMYTINDLFESPFIESIELNKVGKVRRARIFYLRDLSGKKARIKEKKVATVKEA